MSSLPFLKNFYWHYFFLVHFYVYNSRKKIKNHIFWSYLLNFGLQICLDPLIRQKKIVSFIGFMVLKTTGLSSRFQCKNRFWKIRTESRDIGQNVSKYEGLVWRPEFGHILVNISGPYAYFSKPIFALKPWAQAGRFEYHEAYKRNKKFFAS